MKLRTINKTIALTEAEVKQISMAATLESMTFAELCRKAAVRYSRVRAIIHERKTEAGAI